MNVSILVQNEINSQIAPVFFPFPKCHRPFSFQGHFDSCTKQYKDLRIAINAKVTKDEAEARRMIAGTFYKQNLGSDLKNSPTAGAIWELKDKPGWDVE